MKSCRNTLILLILLNSFLFSQESIDLWSISYSLSDSTRLLTADDILDLPLDDFIPPHSGPRQISMHYPTYLLFDLPAANTGQRYLCLSPQTTDSIILLQNGIPIALSGSNAWIKDRTSPASRNGYILPNDAGSYLLKLTDYTNNFKRHTTKPLSIFLLNSTFAWEAKQKEIASQLRLNGNSEAWFLAFISTVLLLVFLSWIILRENTFGYYVLYVAAILMYYLVRRSYFFSTEVFYLPSWVRIYFEILWIPLIFLSYSLFVKAFLTVRPETHTPRVFRVLKLAITLAIGAFITSSISLLTIGLYWSGRFSTFTQLCFAPVTGYLVFLILHNRDRFSRIIASGMTLLILGALLILLNNWLKAKYGVDLEPPPFGFFQYAILLELLLYWLGLLYSWYDLRQESIGSQRELEKLRRELALREKDMSQKQLIITTSRRQYKLVRAQVQGFMADREITYCLLAGGQTVSIPLRLGQIKEQLPKEFLKVQRSYVVNKNLIVRLETGRKARLLLAEWPSFIPVGNGFLKGVQIVMDES